jgi:hypothetical protein
MKNAAAMVNKLRLHRATLCARLLGMCAKLNYETKRDNDCEAVCVVDGEDISEDPDTLKAEEEKP